MSQHLAPHHLTSMTDLTPIDLASAGDSRGEGVIVVKLFSKLGSRRRVVDEPSTLDRAAMQESVRHGREAEELRRRLEAEVHRARFLR